ncbi:EthD domain-containing protein [Bradyrhizobium sp. 930_D9_N1_4]|uniref:EthD domain-containing protein n=1 Tax=Bradyrhizobium sp. 930_D9_N1_4 TaxID=3240374 RepID=UPI003F8A7967
MLNIAGLKELDRNAPVVMLNLMRFHERSRDGNGSGWDAYLRYSAITVPMIRARGGTLLWTGDAKAIALGPHDGNDWDFVALVYYPSVAAFLDMMTSEAYEIEADHHRVNGCAEHLIIATSEAYSKFRTS